MPVQLIMVWAAVHAATRKAADERGFTMVTLMGAMVVMILFSVAAFAAVDGDVPAARQSHDRKEAYAAAEAGVHEYLFQLNQDFNFWTQCTGPATAPGGQIPLNNAWDGTGSDPRTQFRSVPGSTATYKIELLPAPGSGYSQCNTGTPEASMIDPRTGAFRIRSTGFARGEKRSVVATFRRKSFLDFVYFTDLETLDPIAYGAWVYNTTPDLATWAASPSNCAQYYRTGRGNANYSGTYVNRATGATGSFTYKCTEITFITGEQIAGGFHTNDEAQICGTPTFGRDGKNDVWETSGLGDSDGSADGWRRKTLPTACSDTTGVPTFKGPQRPGSAVLSLPPSNGDLKKSADPAYKFTGKTTIVLGASNMTVTNNGTTSTMAYPSSGVIYVSNGSCGVSYDVLNPYPGGGVDNGCGDVWVKGTYGESLTIGADRDIVINGNTTRSGDKMLGLIANQFVRVWHPATHNATDTSQCTNDATAISNVQIDAAILAIQHSFITDNYYCGAPLGTITLNGAIAQKYRGPVGNGSPAAGFNKSYTYDDRLRYRHPPHFLDPVKTAWRLFRQTEQVPAR